MCYFIQSYINCFSVKTALAFLPSLKNLSLIKLLRWLCISVFYSVYHSMFTLVYSLIKLQSFYTSVYLYSFHTRISLYIFTMLQFPNIHAFTFIVLLSCVGYFSSSCSLTAALPLNTSIVVPTSIQ